MTFPGVLTFDLLTPKIPTSTPPLGWGGLFFLGRNHPQICRDLCKSASMIPSRSDTLGPVLFG